MTLKRTQAMSLALIFLSLSLISSFVGQDAQAAGRQLGTVKSISGNTVTLTTDAGTESAFQVQDSTRMLRTEPGQKDLTGAATIKLQDIQVGDRLLVRGKPGSDGKTLAATSVVAMKQGDIAQKQQKELQDWQRRGVGGLVKSVDGSNGTATISTLSASGAKDVTIKTTKETVVRRYSADSVKFDDAKPAMLTDIKAGDQLRARGQRSADGSELTAEEIIGGSFRNVAGVIASVDSANNTITVNDLATKKPVTVRLTSDSQIKKLPAQMAQMIALRLKGGPTIAAAATPAAEARPATGGRGGGGQGAGTGVGAGRGQGGGDVQQMLNRVPSATAADLQKGEAVMMVATQGSNNSNPTAITLLGGVEPILTASPDQSGQSLLTPWSLGGGGGSEAGGGEAPAQ